MLVYVFNDIKSQYTVEPVIYYSNIGLIEIFQKFRCMCESFIFMDARPVKLFPDKIKHIWIIVKYQYVYFRFHHCWTNIVFLWCLINEFTDGISSFIKYMVGSSVAVKLITPELTACKVVAPVADV